MNHKPELSDTSCELSSVWETILPQVKRIAYRIQSRIPFTELDEIISMAWLYCHEKALAYHKRQARRVNFKAYLLKFMEKELGRRITSTYGAPVQLYAKQFSTYINSPPSYSLNQGTSNPQQYEMCFANVENDDEVLEMLKHCAFLERIALIFHFGLFGTPPRTLRNIGENILLMTESHVGIIIHRGLERIRVYERNRH